MYLLSLFILRIVVVRGQGKDDPRKCPQSNSGCIFDDDVEGTDCLAGGNAVCLAIGADYCSAVFGDPAQRFCCTITDAVKIHSHPDIRGCPPSTQGCIFDDIVHGADCTKGGNSDCLTAGGDYCSAWHGYPPRRVCCTIADSAAVELTASIETGCPDSMSGCIFDDFINGADCSQGGNLACIASGSDYCSGWTRDSDGKARRLCCDIAGQKPFGPAKADGSHACPANNSGCIYDDSVNGADCTKDGNAACKNVGSDYCSAFFGKPPRRVCCDITRDEATEAAIAAYKKTCPSSHSGCIYDDEVEGTDCTVAGNAACYAVAADYCSAVFGFPPQRVCCRISDGNSPSHKSDPNVRGCPPSNLGCIFDDVPHGADCTTNGNDDCFAIGSDYCSAWFGHPPRRVCCDIARDSRSNKLKGTYDETCPISNMGCIYDDYIHGANCTEIGNAKCVEEGSDYCSAWIGDPPNRFCCSHTNRAAPSREESGNDGTRACPVSNSGCIYDDLIDGTDCTYQGNEACIAAGANYCSGPTGVPTRRVCCIISGKIDLRMYLLVTISVSFGILIVILAIFALWFHYNKKKQQALLWKIHLYQLHKVEQNVDGSRTTRATTGSESSLASSGSHASAMTTASRNSARHINYEYYMFKGAPVAVVKHPAGVPVKETDKNEFVVMREMSHDNVNPFLGLSDEGLSILSVWKLCPKGSLLDLFEKENLKLDWVFKYSLIKDMVEGMDYIAKSQLKSHGYLNSKCCLVDNRWQLKISDYGLKSIRKVKKIDTIRNELVNHILDDVETVVSAQFWRAPELIRDNHVKNVLIDADIYSMAIIMSEIVTRAAAYSAIEATADEIVYRVRKGEKPPFRPLINLPADNDVNPVILQLMKDCWEEDPHSRPNMRTIRHTLKSMMKGRSTNLMDHVMMMMEEYAGTLEAEVNERTKELGEEKKKADIMLYRLLPKSVVEKLKSGLQVDPQVYDSVTILCSDIVDFTALAQKSRPGQIVSLLNELYNICDSIIDQYDIYKAETSTDGYVCVSGLPIPNGNNHAKEIAEMALNFRRSITQFRIPHLPREKIKVRIGVHTGSVVAGVVGLTMPRYCLFGEAILIAARMEASSKPNQIHITEETKNFITDIIGGYTTSIRGEILLKGVGVKNTHWLVGNADEFSGGNTEQNENMEE